MLRPGAFGTAYLHKEVRRIFCVPRTAINRFPRFLAGSLLASLMRRVGRKRSSTMVGLSDEQRRMLIDKLPDVANVALGALWLVSS